jgi:hypothetical protein
VLLLGGLLLLLAVAALTLSYLAHRLRANQVVVVPLFVAAAALGLVVLRRQPRNAVGWVWIGVLLVAIVNAIAQEYALLRYRDHYRGLPLGPAAVFVCDTFWALLFLLVPLIILLFPDGRLPSRGWRWALWAYLGLWSLVMVGQFAGAAGGVIGRRIEVNGSGQNINSWNSTSFGTRLANIGIGLAPLIGLLMLSFVIAQIVAWRRASGERRQQLKWLMTGSAISVIGLAVTFASAQTSAIPPAIVAVLGVGALALPVSIAVGILKYRLYEIDRLISRTVSYAILTGLLAGVFVGIVVFATDVLPFSSPVAVAASTLAAAALFNPLRRRVQRIVDRRFNRARYDAEATVAAFTARLRYAVDLDTISGELLQAIGSAVEPAHTSLWIRAAATPPERSPSASLLSG